MNLLCFSDQLSTNKYWHVKKPRFNKTSLASGPQCSTCFNLIVLFLAISWTHKKIMRKPKRNHRKNIQEFLGHVWISFKVNIWKRIAQQLRLCVLLHLGLVTFRFHVGEIRKPIILMFFGSLDVSMAPKTNMIYLWRQQISLTNTIVGRYYVWKYHNARNRKF